MSLSVADIDRWTADSVREVFHAATQRAQITQNVSRELAALSVFESWDGEAADAARHAIATTRRDLDAHGDEAASVASAAARAADAIDKVKADLQTVRAEAESHGLEIDPVSGAVVPAPGARHGRREMQEWIPRIAAQLAAVIAEANAVDAELAAAINMADGDTPIPSSPADAVPPPPAPTTDPHEVRRWWESLTREQRTAELNAHQAELGNLDGIPSAVRQQLNAARLPGEIADARARLDALPHNAKPNPAQIDQREGAVNKLADLLRLQQVLRQHSDVGLLLLDTSSNQKNVLAAIAKGDVDNAERVGVTVGGMTTNVRGSAEGMTNEAINQYNAAVELRLLNRSVLHPDAVASVAWLGYEAPGMNFDVTDDSMARVGAASLNHFYKGLDATTNAVEQHITAFGHSYGSLTTSLALQQGAPVDDVVLYGSPGGELSNTSQLGVGPGHAYFINGVTDGVPTTIPETRYLGGGFGPPLSEIPGFTDLSAYSGQAASGTVGDGDWHERAYGHSEYARAGDNGELRMSAYNMAAVLAGLPQDTVSPPADPPQPFIAGPRGLIPNPDYHP